MILDPTGQNAAISSQMMKQGVILQIGQGIFQQAVASMIAAGRVITEQTLVDAATKSVQAAAAYIALAEATAQQGSK